MSPIVNINQEIQSLMADSSKDSTIKIKTMADIVIECLHTQMLTAMRNPNQPLHKKSLETMSEELSSMMTLKDCAHYILQTSDSIKGQYAKNIMKHYNNPLALENLLTNNPQIIESLTTHTSTLSSLWNRTAKATSDYTSGYMGAKKTRGHELLEALFTRYQFPREWLTMTELQVQLLNSCQTKDFAQGLSLLKQSTIEDFLKPDLYGRTSLHYLMEHADCPQAYELIIGLLDKASHTDNFNLDIQDHDGNTALHMLMENKNAQVIQEKVKNHIFSSSTTTSSSWFYSSTPKQKSYNSLEDFFDFSIKNKRDETPKDIREQQTLKIKSLRA